jgi:hypothetical protein
MGQVQLRLLPKGVPMARLSQIEMVSILVVIIPEVLAQHAIPVLVQLLEPGRG